MQLWYSQSYWWYLSLVFWHCYPLFSVGPVSSVRSRELLSGGAVNKPVWAATSVVQRSIDRTIPRPVKWFSVWAVSSTFSLSMALTETSTLTRSGSRVKVMSVKRSAAWFRKGRIPVMDFKTISAGRQALSCQVFILVRWGVVVVWATSCHVGLRVWWAGIIRVVKLNPEGDGGRITVCICYMNSLFCYSIGNLR